ncbi:putative zinc binding dehydrogenase [Cadophora sp. MPI-SDFR-AT-0126]|nr:putative zinc binding dehydrogenase [Leotiomycetes sp. MPI-SDFR-AT-0126]
MKEFFLIGNPLRGELRDVDIPVPKDNEVLIKVMATDSNPKDWKMTSPDKYINQGDDIAGIVSSVGSLVIDFRTGDRVAAFHPMLEPHGAHAEFAIVPSSTTFHLPPNISFEAGSTLPLAGMTASLALYQHLSIPPPWNPIPASFTSSSAPVPLPIIIYGGASSVGAYALKFAKLSRCYPIITIAGNGIPFVESLNAADAIIDYRVPGIDITAEIRKALKGREALHAFDAVCARDSWKHILDVLPKDGRASISMVDPPQGVSPWPPAEMRGIRYVRTFVASAHGKAYQERSEEEAGWDADFAFVMFRYFSRLLADGRLTPHPFEVLGGLEEVAKGTQMLFDKKVSSKKLVYRIADTKGL